MSIGTRPRAMAFARFQQRCLNGIFRVKFLVCHVSPEYNHGWELFADSDFASDSDPYNKRKSQYGYIACCNGAPVLWCSKVASVAFADATKYDTTSILYEWWEMEQDPFTGEYNSKTNTGQILSTLPGSFITKSFVQCKVTVTFSDSSTTEIWSNIVTANDGLTVGAYIDEAPNDGKLYGRQGRNWVEIV